MYAAFLLSSSNKNLKSILNHGGNLRHCVIVKYSRVLQFARKSGSKALESPSRTLSRKQMKRRNDKLKENSSGKHVDPKINRQKVDFLTNQLESPEAEGFIREIEERLSKSVRELMLPNHLLDVVDIEDIGGVKKSVETTIDYEKLLMRLRDIKMLSNTQRKSPDILEVGNSSTAMSIVGSTSVDESANMTLHLAEDAIELDDISAALLHFSINDCSKTITLYNSIKDLKISKGLSDAALVGVMRAHLSGGSLKEVDRIFDSMIKDNNSPSVEMWELKIRSTARAKQPDAALAMVDRLVKAGIDTNCAMYTDILDQFVTAARFNEAYDLWERMHFEPGLQLSSESFDVMMRYCALQGQVERAFFYLDEMKTVGIEPTLTTFHALFRACATAPHWVNGYHDIIFDAMDAMEGCELQPTLETYNCVIHAFARACDAVAAEYYFWEMIRKGIQPNKETYASLLRAHAEAQSVGAHKYSSKGRYCRPSPPPPTEDEQAMLDVGPSGVAEIMSSGIMSEFDPQPGKRVKPRITDLYDDEMPEERDRQIMQAVRFKANELNRSGHVEGAVDGELQWDDNNSNDDGNDSNGGDSDDDGDEVDIYELARNDPQLQALLSEAERGDPAFVQSLSSLQEELSRPSSHGHHKTDRNRHQDGEEEDGGRDHYANKTGDLSRRPAQQQQRKERQEKSAAEQELQLMRRLLADKHETRYLDPFAHLTDSKCRQGGSPLPQGGGEEEEKEKVAYQPQHSSLVMLLDRLQSSKTMMVMDDDNDDSSEEGRQVEAPPPRGPITDAYVQEQWELLHFGRAPNTDFHSRPLGARRKQNVLRAQLAFDHMLASGISPDVKILNELLAVHAEAVHVEDALAVLNRFAKFGVEPNERTYRYLIRMHIRNGDVASAVELKDEMKRTKGIVPHKDSYGLILQSYTHRDMVVEALKVLEEAASDQRSIPEMHLKFLRSRCVKLGIKHPNIPANPKQWVADTKDIRRRQKHSPQSRIEHVRTKLFN